VETLRELAGVEEQPFGGTLGLTRLGFCRMKAREKNMPTKQHLFQRASSRAAQQVFSL